MIYLKRHHSENGFILALCDEELIGKRYEDGKRQLDLETYSGFYKGERLDEKSAEEEVSKEKFYSANIVGKRSISIFVKHGLLDKSGISEICGIPYAQIFSISD
ncbi:MAG: DUF424 family protein [Candidatus Micrarchaeaceae archaeon]